MDLITVIWYFSTFIALVAFFIVMACSDNYCGRNRKPEEPPTTAPPTPAPSYREFAPPSYDTVMKKYKNRIFIIPPRAVTVDDDVKAEEEIEDVIVTSDNNNNNNSNNNNNNNNNNPNTVYRF